MDEKYRLMLLDLLAVIHRDGGHKTEEIGIDLAFKQAMQLSSERAASTPSRNDVLEEAAKAAWGAQIYPVEDMTTDPALWAAFRYGKDCAVAAIRARKDQTDG